jgi:cellobiose-specific phosphotransferase system component IIA
MLVFRALSIWMQGSSNEAEQQLAVGARRLQSAHAASKALMQAELVRTSTLRKLPAELLQQRALTEEPDATGTCTAPLTMLLL